MKVAPIELETSPVALRAISRLGLLTGPLPRPHFNSSVELKGMPTRFKWLWPTAGGLGISDPKVARTDQGMPDDFAVMIVEMGTLESTPALCPLEVPLSALVGLPGKT